MSWDRIGPRLSCIIPCPKQPLFSQTGPLAAQQTKGCWLGCPMCHWTTKTDSLCLPISLTARLHKCGRHCQCPVLKAGLASPKSPFP